MRKIKEVLRLRFALGLNQDQIARSCSIAQSSVHRYLERAATSGLNWPLPPDYDDRKLNELLFPSRIEPCTSRNPPGPDFAAVHRELQSNAHVTLQLLWEEYKQAHPDGYSRTRFYELYREWGLHLDVVLRQEHRAGEKLFVDYAGATIPIYDEHTAQVHSAAVFVAVLGASSYTYAEATWTQELGCWLGSHVRAFEFFGGCPKLIVPDNCKTGVNRSCRYEPDLNRTYHDMATHYGVAVMPARPYKPRDKAKVESGVQVVQRWIVAALRHRRFFSLGELNEAMGNLLERLNNRPFRKRSGTRASLFESLDRHALQPLPAQPYQYAEWKTLRVSIDYHVEIERHYYSVPYQLTGKHVEARFTAGTVEIFYQGQRVTSHARSLQPYQYTTIHAHRPKSHQAHLEWTPSRLIHWAATVGPSTAQLFEAVLASKPHPEMGYRACLGILRLGKAYTAERLEAAATRAVRLNACSYQSIKSILQRGLDRQALLELSQQDKPGPSHDNIRGAHYYDPPSPRNNPDTHNS